MKDLEYYMSLPYRVEIQPIPENQGGGVMASVPRLGRYAVCADGETIEEALEMLEEVKRGILEDYLKEGVPIPEPEPLTEEYSGKFVVRIPRSLHRDLALKAKENNVSLNQFVTSLLAQGVAHEGWRRVLSSVERRLSQVGRRIQERDYSVDIALFNHIGQPPRKTGFDKAEAA